MLAGGRGTRLGPLTDEVPKPMLDVGGRPFIEWVVGNLRRHGVDDVVVTVGYRAEAFRRWVAGLGSDPMVRLFEEREPLDTGGALCEMADELSEVFFVLNGDTLFDVPFQALGRRLLEATEPEPSIALALRSVDDAGRYGAVELTEGRVSSFAEKTRRGEPGWINGGVYVLRRQAMAGRRSPLSIERTLIPELVAEHRVTALPCDGFFIDIGVPETYREAQTRVPSWWASSGG